MEKKEAGGYHSPRAVYNNTHTHASRPSPSGHDEGLHNTNAHTVTRDTPFNVEHNETFSTDNSCCSKGCRQKLDGSFPIGEFQIHPSIPNSNSNPKPNLNKTIIRI